MRARVPPCQKTSLVYAEVDVLCETRLERFATVVVFRVADLVAAGVDVVPTFGAPHVPSPRSSSTRSWTGSWRANMRQGPTSTTKEATEHP
jgi:hypothetical protein